MHVRIVDNTSNGIASVLSETIGRSDEVKIAVAFVSSGGLTMIGPAIQAALRIGAYVEFFVGLDGKATEPEAVLHLYELSHKNTNVGLYCYAPLGNRVIFHPKLYLLRAENNVTSIIGSSNLTRGGLQQNFEVNVVMNGTIYEEAISNSYDAYNVLKFRSKARVPDEETLLSYLAVFQREKEASRKVERDDSLRKHLAEFKEKFESLPRPKPTRRDIAGGWLELVYDVLPSGEFTNEQVYAFEQMFQERYPENRNIRAKIRQQLQMLRNMELIRQLGVARWQKL